jgi:diguanylate cyclase (GGDEF)-like protein
LELIGGLLTSESESEKKFAVLFLDLNRFKTLNDSLGHSVGDRLIISVAQRLRTLIREGDVVGRFSGDEFSIILQNISSRDDATEFATRLSKKMAEPFSLDGRQVFTSVAIGISFYDPKYENSEEILRDADIAMYYAKDRQKDFEIFDRKMHAKAVSLLDLETDLRFAILRNEFELFYQPIVNLVNAKIEGFEALVRWNHPKWGLVRPDEFIPVAETTGLIIPMTVQVLRSACMQIVNWQQLYMGLDDLMVSVNLSSKHFAVPGLVEQISGILQETTMNPRNLRLEITESAVMENAENSIAMLQRIKELGARISIDDFGTGYSSLSYLHRFPVDTLKVDRSFVSTMEAGTENGEIVRTIIALARALKLSVVAEGIESIHQFHQLRTLRCEYGQGYLFSRPLPVKEAEKLLTDTTSWYNIIPQDGYSPDVVERPQERLELTH